MNIYSKSNPPPGFYVYAYIRKTNGTPYYIGKGKNLRAWDKHKFAQKPNDYSKIIILESNLTELGALAIERRLIKWWGRKDLGTGILLNKTNGGEGLNGYRIPKEDRYKYSKPGEKNGMFGRKHSEEIKIASSIRRTETNRARRWYNNGIVSKFLKEPSGPEWKLGRINQKPTTAGNRWYNNGIINISTSVQPIGNEWVIGMLPKNR